MSPWYFLTPGIAAREAQHLVYYASDRVDTVTAAVMLIVLSTAALYMSGFCRRNNPVSAHWTGYRELAFALALLAVGFCTPGWPGYFAIVIPVIVRFILEFRRRYHGDPTT